MKILYLDEPRAPHPIVVVEDLEDETIERGRAAIINGESRFRVCEKPGGDYGISKRGRMLGRLKAWVETDAEVVIVEPLDDGPIAADGSVPLLD